MDGVLPHICTASAKVYIKHVLVQICDYIQLTADGSESETRRFPFELVYPLCFVEFVQHLKVNIFIMNNFTVNALLFLFILFHWLEEQNGDLIERNPYRY